MVRHRNQKPQHTHQRPVQKWDAFVSIYVDVTAWMTQPRSPTGPRTREMIVQSAQVPKQLGQAEFTSGRRAGWAKFC